VKDADLQALAGLAVRLGANVQRGQVVAVAADPEAAPLVHAVTEAAYRIGARFVDVAYFDPEVKRLRIQHADPETLGYVPPWIGDRLLGLGEHRSARISIVPQTPPGLLDGLDPELAGRDGMPFLKENLRLIDQRSTNWTVVPYPTPRWAAAVYRDLDPDQALERLTEQVVHVCRLAEPDPTAAWRERLEALKDVARRLDERRFDAIHLAGPGTDLTVGLLPTSHWAAATAETALGVPHAPNIPTEEVFTGPDPERVDGVVAATLPLEVNGALVTGLRVRFEGGRAVDIDADENAEALIGRCDVDDGARRLGELALVDRESRIGRSGTVFMNTLLDENAASHVAFGNAYLMTAGEEDHARLNRSDVHVDFMVGGDEVDVTGLTGDGERVPVLRGGTWQI
jgi:aminopeptidase